MSSPPPHSLLITPDLRRRLQQMYEQALRLAAQPKPDFRRIHDLLAQCVRSDPGNILYLNALLANLARRETAIGTSWWSWWWHGRSGTSTRPASSPVQSTAGSSAVHSAEYSVLSTAPDALWSHPSDVAIMHRAAEAASQLDFDEIELRYLHAALEAASDDLDCQRMLARALTRQGRFEAALAQWQALAQAIPGDSEALQAIADLQQIADFAAAEDRLATAQAAAGGDLAILGQREDLRLQHSDQRVKIAELRALADPHPKAQSLVARFRDERNRLEIEIVNARAERLPTDAEVRVQLAQRLKAAGNYSGAVQRLEEALRIRPGDPAALLELGECWQHLRQFQKALDYYREALASGPVSDGDETRKLAHYRAGILAAALGDAPAARSHFEAILAVDPAFKDAPTRLDNLPQG